LKNQLKRLVNRFTSRHYFIEPVISAKQQQDFVSQLTEFDLVVVVCPIPRAFLASELKTMESLRQQLKIPFVLYQNYYLATRGPWYQQIKQRGGFGLERFDWYLGASLVSDFALQGAEHPFSLIGHDLRHPQLQCDWPAKSEQPFKVLLDFARPGFEEYRELQIEALQRTNTPYTELKGLYSPAQIRALYRQHHGLMLSFRESFGLPIVENQLCGNWIFTPYASWTPSHFIDKAVDESGEGRLGSNFVVYDNDLKQLMVAIEQCKQTPPQTLFEHFCLEYPQLHHGDLTALQQFCLQVGSKNIDALSHQNYLHLNSLITD
jgi:hypothetical protein